MNDDFVYNMDIELYKIKYFKEGELLISDEKTDLTDYLDNDYKYKVFIRTIKFKKHDFIYCSDYVYTVYYDGNKYENVRTYIDSIYIK
jgi:hypothetical protein